MTNSKDSYEKRVKGRVGEDVFEKYCKSKGLRYWRTGFDEKDDPVSRFWDIDPAIRSMPDYLIESTNNKLSWVHVKGTPNFKINDLLLYSQFDRERRGDCSFYVAFCFRNQDPTFMSFDQLMKKLTNLMIKEWDDGKQYVTIPV